MITLKKQYALGFGLQTVAVALVVASELAEGKYKLTPAGKEGVLEIATTIAMVGIVIHGASHARLIGRGVKSLYRAVNK